MIHLLFLLRQESHGRSLRPRMVLVIADWLGLDISEDMLSFDRSEDGAGGGLEADAAGRRGWRKATAAAMFGLVKLVAKVRGFGRLETKASDLSQPLGSS